MNLASSHAKIDGLLTRAGGLLQPVLLLCLRLGWGWGFFLAGQGKLLHLDKAAKFFAELGFPAPQLNVILAALVEGVGGLFLIAGLFSRITCVPLIVTMVVAYATAHRAELTGIFSQPDEFTGAAPFLYLLVALIILAFGPGRLSLDALIFQRGGAK